MEHNIGGPHMKITATNLIEKIDLMNKAIDQLHTAAAHLNEVKRLFEEADSLSVEILVGESAEAGQTQSPKLTTTRRIPQWSTRNTD